MTNKQVIDLYNGLCKLEEKKIQLPIIVGYGLAKDKTLLEEEVKLIYNFQHKILLKYGNYNNEKDIIVPKEKVDEANKELEELLNMENGIELVQIPITAFKDLQFTLEEMKALQYIINLNVDP